jgi:hypothetical protein
MGDLSTEKVQQIDEHFEQLLDLFLNLIVGCLIHSF